MSITTTVWAIGARGITPAAKLVLILAADAGDMDGRCFAVDAVRDRANMTDDALTGAVAELAAAGLAILTDGVEPASGSRGRCIALMCAEAIR